MKNGDNVSGKVVFSADGKRFEGPLLDGKYTVINVPKGEYDVLVESPLGGMVVPPPTIKDATKDMPTAKAGTSPPPKYAQPKSLLKFTVKGGKETHNIILDP